MANEGCGGPKRRRKRQARNPTTCFEVSEESGERQKVRPCTAAAAGGEEYIVCFICLSRSDCLINIRSFFADAEESFAVPAALPSCSSELIKIETQFDMPNLIARVLMVRHAVSSYGKPLHPHHIHHSDISRIIQTPILHRPKYPLILRLRRLRPHVQIRTLRAVPTPPSAQHVSRQNTKNHSPLLSRPLAHILRALTHLYLCARRLRDLSGGALNKDEDKTPVRQALRLERWGAGAVPAAGVAFGH